MVLDTINSGKMKSEYFDDRMDVIWDKGKHWPETQIIIQGDGLAKLEAQTFTSQ